RCRPNAPIFVRLAGCARLIQILAARAPEGGGGKLQLATFEGLDVLHTPFAIASLAQNDGPAVILQTGGDDLAAAGTAAVDQADHGEVNESSSSVAALRGLFPVRRLAPQSRPGSDRNNQSVVDEHVGNLDRAGEKSARIETQIENEPVYPFPVQLAYDTEEVSGRIAREALQTDVADLIARVDVVLPLIIVLAFGSQD